MALPTAPTPQQVDLRRARMLVHAPQGAGKTSLFGGWFPDSTLIIDFDDAWKLLPGAHYTVVPKTYAEVMHTVVELTTTQHQFQTVIVDTVTRLWRMADLDAGGRYGKNAAGVVEFGKGTADRDGTLMRVLGPLLQSGLGVVLLAHSRRPKLDDGKLGEFIPSIDDRIAQDVTGGVDFEFFLDHKSAPGRRLLLTQPNALAECKTRFSAMPMHVEIPPVQPGDDGREAARALHAAMTTAAQAQTKTPSTSAEEA